MTTHKQSGFTVIELIVVTCFIGIMLGVIATAYQGIEARNRNQARIKAVNAVQKQLEAYYQTAGHYPTLTNINSSRWLETNMAGLDPTLLQDPTGTNSELAEIPQKDTYSYAPANANNTSCESEAITCVNYTLTATLEGDTVYTKQNDN